MLTYFSINTSTNIPINKNNNLLINSSLLLGFVTYILKITQHRSVR